MERKAEEKQKELMKEKRGGKMEEKMEEKALGKKGRLCLGMAVLVFLTLAMEVAVLLLESAAYGAAPSALWQHCIHWTLTCAAWGAGLTLVPASPAEGSCSGRKARRRVRRRAACAPDNGPR